MTNPHDRQCPPCKCHGIGADGEHALESVTRLTVVSNSSRILETWGISNVAMALQDDGRTLKLFYREENK